jgi:hypothetical protein
MGAALHQEQAEGNLVEAIALYRRVMSLPGASRAVQAHAQLRIAICQERLNLPEAARSYQAVIGNFSDQVAVVTQATRHLRLLWPVDTVETAWIQQSPPSFQFRRSSPTSLRACRA